MHGYAPPRGEGDERPLFTAPSGVFLAYTFCAPVAMPPASGGWGNGRWRREGKERYMTFKGFCRALSASLARRYTGSARGNSSQNGHGRPKTAMVGERCGKKHAPAHGAAGVNALAAARRSL